MSEMKLTPEEAAETNATEDERREDREAERWRKRKVEFVMVREFERRERR